MPDREVGLDELTWYHWSWRHCRGRRRCQLARLLESSRRMAVAQVRSSCPLLCKPQTSLTITFWQ